MRVLELGNYIAAPTAGRMLADFGAEVIKVERPRTGDELRNWRLYAGDTSMLYRTINRNKKSDRARPAAPTRAATSCSTWSRTATSLLENFRPGTLEKWGLGPDVLDEANPDLVLTRISAFGQTGPLAQRPGFRRGRRGLRRAARARRRPRPAAGAGRGVDRRLDRGHLRGVRHGDGAVPARAHGPTSARRQHRRVPLPRIIDVALNEAILSVMESLMPDYLAYGVNRERVGGRMEGIAPFNAYPCADGTSIVIAGNGDAIFDRYMQTIGRPDLGADPGLQTNAGRWERRDELDDAIGTGRFSTPATRRCRSSTRPASRAVRSTPPPTSSPTNSTPPAT